MKRCAFLAAAVASAVGLQSFAAAAEAGSASASQEHEPAPAVITVSKASDGLGAPIDLRPRVKLSANVSGRVSVPDRLPLARAALTSRFGMRRHPVLGGYRMHSGVDLAVPAGSPIAAPADGVVSYADWRGGYGLLVTLEHGGGLQTRFAHLSRLMVSQGQQVTKGQLVGLVGSTGRSTGAHLHYELRSNGRAVDPLAQR